MITTAMDGYKCQTGDSVINFMNRPVHKSSFEKCVAPGPNRLSAEFYAAEMMEIMKQKMSSRGMDDVEDAHAGFVADKHKN